MSSSTRLDVFSVCLPPDDNYPFYITAKRYRSTDHASAKSGTRANTRAPVTLLLMHSTSFHKEIYEPMLASLFSHASQDGAPHIREAWAVECPNHGASATLNAALLLRAPYDEYCKYPPTHAPCSPLTGCACVVSCERYAEAVERFLALADVRPATDRLVCIGHSLGGCAASVRLFSAHLCARADSSQAVPLRARAVRVARARGSVPLSRRRRRLRRYARAPCRPSAPTTRCLGGPCAGDGGPRSAE